MDYPSLTASFAGTHALYQWQVAPAQVGNFIVQFSSQDAYNGQSRPTHNGNPLGLGRRDAETRWVFGLPDVWRFTEANPNGEPSSIVLDFDKQHYLLYINTCMVTRRVWTRQEYFDAFNARAAYPYGLIGGLETALKDDRSHTNGHGLNNSRNYLRGTNMDSGDPLFAKLITGHARLRLLDDRVQLRGVPPLGECVAFHCINAAGSDLWTHNPIDEPWLFDMPCVTGRVVVKDKAGTHILRDDLIYPYGIFSDCLVFPIWLPRVSVGYVPYSLTRSLRSDETMQKEWIRG